MKKLRSLNLGGKAPRCPLCHKWMERKFDHTRGFFIFACDTVESCNIAIPVDDPFVGRWDEALANGEPILCPRPSCERPMRYFATSIGFIKTYCAKCKATVKGHDAKEDRPTDKVYTPENPGVLQ